MPVAWMADDGTGRVIDAKAKDAGTRASATRSATAIYSIPLFPNPAPQQHEGASEAVLVFGIEIEKLLCAKLGIDWTPTGISIESLIERLAARPAPLRSVTDARPNQSDRDQVADLILTDPESGEPCAVVSTLRSGPGGFNSFEMQTGPDSPIWRVEVRVSEFVK